MHATGSGGSILLQPVSFEFAERVEVYGYAHLLRYGVSLNSIETVEEPTALYPRALDHRGGLREVCRCHVKRAGWRQDPQLDMLGDRADVAHHLLLDQQAQCL